MQPTITDAIKTVTSGTALSSAHSHAVFSAIMQGEATPAQIAALIVALKMKGETIDEITGAARAMREKASKVIPQSLEHCVDTCGTGGDHSDTFNISTATAFVTAAAGARVAKHGNRAVSSRSGSADVLEALGVKIAISPEAMKACLDDIGIVFLFAQQLHAAMKHAAVPRKEIGIRTIFNILGPLTNPSGAPAQVLGVYSTELTNVLAQVLSNLGTRKAYVVHGLEGLDEVSVCGPTRVAELSGGTVRSYDVVPEEFGMQRASLQDLKGGTAEENAVIIKNILSRKELGAKRDVVVLNSAFALAAAEIAPSPALGITLAQRAIDSGAALQKLHMMITESNRY